MHDSFWIIKFVGFDVRSQVKVTVSVERSATFSGTLTLSNKYVLQLYSNSSYAYGNSTLYMYVYDHLSQNQFIDDFKNQ